MSAIFGQLNTDIQKPVGEDLLEAMSASLRHRGNDLVTFHLERNLGMGMSSLELSPIGECGGVVHNEDKSISAVYDGEFYNYRELREELAAQGHRFSTSRDGEVLVHLYEARGTQCWQALNGIFAAAIWDARERELILGRDRLGFKPLYYAQDKNRLLFASGLWALLRAGLSRDIDRQALHDYLSFDYIPAPRSIFSRARKLLPGHFLTARVSGEVEVKEYWDLVFTPTPQQNIDQTAANLFALMCAAVKRRIGESDSVAVFLSGGLDSSTMLALCHELEIAKIRTFTIGFSESSYSELDDAQKTADHFGSEHHHTLLNPDPAEFLPKLVEFYDEPFADSSAIPVYYVSRFARDNGAKVILGGDGGDELFAGYYTYNAMQYAAFYRRLPKFISGGIIPGLVKLLPTSDEKISFDFKLKSFIRAAGFAPETAHYWWKLLFTEAMKRKLYASGEIPPDCEDTINVFSRYFGKCRAEELLSRMQYVDTKVGLPDDGLVKVERLTMANSLQLRTPVMDNEVVDFILKVPARAKLRGRTKKYIVKKMMAGRLPEHVLKGKKRGFATPIPKWIKGLLAEPLRRTLGEDNLKKQGFFNPRYVRELIEDHVAGKADYSRHLWGLLLFTLWYERYGRAG